MKAAQRIKEIIIILNQLRAQVSELMTKRMREHIR